MEYKIVSCAFRRATLDMQTILPKIPIKNVRTNLHLRMVQILKMRLMYRQPIEGQVGAHSIDMISQASSV